MTAQLSLNKPYGQLQEKTKFPDQLHRKSPKNRLHEQVVELLKTILDRNLGCTASKPILRHSDSEYYFKQRL